MFARFVAFFVLASGAAVSCDSSSFAYSVGDPHSSDFKNQVETRKGNNVHGQYSLLESHSTRRTVDYAAWIGGFNAVVRKDPALITAPVISEPIFGILPIGPIPTLTEPISRILPIGPNAPTPEPIFIILPIVPLPTPIEPISRILPIRPIAPTTKSIFRILLVGPISAPTQPISRILPFRPISAISKIRGIDAPFPHNRYY